MTPNEEFEQALVDVATKARDGEGRQVMLLPLELTADTLREATRDFARNFIGPNDAVIFLGTLNGEIVEHRGSEVAAWRNLALLATATAAAVKAGK